MQEEAPDRIEEYGLEPFQMKVQGMERTLVDKVFAICDYYLQKKVKGHSRHLYDIYKLLPLVSLDEKFKQLVQEVREIRAKSVICPSAFPEVDVPELIEKIIEENAYKKDYDEITTQLLAEELSYETAIGALGQIVGSGMFKEHE